SVWQNLPDALSGIAKQAANSVMEVFEGDWLTIGGKTIIPGLDLSGQKFTLSDAERAAMSGAVGSFNSGFDRDYMGEFFGAVRSRAIANSLADIENAADGAADNVRGFSRAFNPLAEQLKFTKGLASGFLNDLRSGLKSGEGVWASFAN